MVTLHTWDRHFVYYSCSLHGVPAAGQSCWLGPRCYALPRPLARRVLVARAVRLVEVCNVRNERVVRVRVREHGADGQQHLGDGERRAPLVPQNIETNAAVGVDVRVVNLRREGHLRRLKGVVRREGYVEEEDATGVGRIRLHRSAMPCHAGARSAPPHTGPMIVACHCTECQPPPSPLRGPLRTWNMLSPVGPALHELGGSRPRSASSYLQSAPVDACAPCYTPC